MLTEIHPKLPMRDKAMTRAFYVDLLGFTDIGVADYKDYLLLRRDTVEIHFFSFPDIDPKENYGQVYIRTNDIKALYAELIGNGVKCKPIETKPWGQTEFSLLDNDGNLLTFGEGV